MVFSKNELSLLFLRDFGKIHRSFIKNEQQINRVLMNLQQTDGTADIKLRHIKNLILQNIKESYIFSRFEHLFDNNFQ